MQPDEVNDANEDGVDGARRVYNILLKGFWQKFINHFKILFMHNEIKWPQRRPITQMPK